LTAGKLAGNVAIGMSAIRADHMTKLVGIREITPKMWQGFVAANFSGSWNTFALDTQSVNGRPHGYVCLGLATVCRRA
jgi:hypothetical protein